MQYLPFCRLCSRVAVVIDAFFPYESKYNRCALHKDH